MTLSVCKNICLILVTSWLFYGTFMAAIAGIPVLMHLVRKDLQTADARRKDRLALEFREALQSMSAAMHAGYSAENSVREAIRDLRTVYGGNGRIVQEFTHMWNELRMQIPAEQVWQNFGARSRVPEIMDFAVVFRTAKRSGGDMLEIMDNTAAAISEKLKVRQEIATVLAAKQLEWKIMTAVPFVIVLYMRISFPEFMSAMYGNAAGAAVMTGALVLFLGAYALGGRILDIEL